MSITVNADRTKISGKLKSNITVSSDEPFTAAEVRATKNGEKYGRGVGLCMFSDDSAVSDGVLTFDEETNEFSFDVEAGELAADASYRISVYVKNTGGVWNDVCPLLTKSEQTVFDGASSQMFAKRGGSGTDYRYVSAYSGEMIDTFIDEVNG